MLSLIATAVALSLQPEIGIVKMAAPPDDTYVEYSLPGDSYHAFTSIAYGMSMRVDASRWNMSIGWRDLGNQSLNEPIMSDAGYFACRAHPATCPKPTTFWHSEGNERQFFVETGVTAYQRGLWHVVPSIGVGNTAISWHTDVYPICVDKLAAHWNSIPQHHNAPFIGMTVERGPVGVGLYVLDTEPVRNLSLDPGYPGQGSIAYYLRVTYRIGL
jgi:hypothetical protein